MITLESIRNSFVVSLHNLQVGIRIMAHFRQYTYVSKKIYKRPHFIQQDEFHRLLLLVYKSILQGKIQEGNTTKKFPTKYIYMTIDKCKLARFMRATGVWWKICLSQIIVIIRSEKRRYSYLIYNLQVLGSPVPHQCK